MTLAGDSKRPTIVWFRLDLRLEDNPALDAAVKKGGPVVPVFIWAPEEEGTWAPGSASRWWLHHSLASLERSLAEVGSWLVIREGASCDTLRALVRETGADLLVWNRRYEPALVSRDRHVAECLRSRGVETRSYNGSLLFDPDDFRNRKGSPYQVFTPFWKACLAGRTLDAPLPAPKRLSSRQSPPSSFPLSSLELERRGDWPACIQATWQPGTKGATQRLTDFLDKGLSTYVEDRDCPTRSTVSRLSPHLHFGEISPRIIWHEVQEHLDRHSHAGMHRQAAAFLRQLAWREFAHHLLHHFPGTPEQPLRAEYARFPWRRDPDALAAWQKGQTGYPIVDAGMRELWTTGWMHNRVRLLVASFLVKDLLIPWQDGARWFWDTLVDADLANNTLGWQWMAGCGADAAPYFRIFNPVSQGERFDRSGDYVRRWVPEVQRLPDRWIHRPWEAPPLVLKHAGVHLGRTYPKPLIDHGEARALVLTAFAALKGNRAAAGGLRRKRRTRA